MSYNRDRDWAPGGHRHPPEAAGDGDHSASRLSDQREDRLDPGQEPDHVDLQRLPVSVQADPLDLTKCGPASVINNAPQSRAKIR